MAATTIIKNARIIRGDQIEEHASLAFENRYLVPVPEHTEGCDIIDAHNQYVCAGFIDLHTHGGGGYDFLDGTKEAFLGAAALHAKYGTTTLLPTATSGTYEETVAMFEAYEDACRHNTAGADMPGIHLEGPYFAPSQAGAQDPRYLKTPNPNEYLPIMNATDKLLRWSAACELDGAYPFADACRERGILCAIGHSDASFECVLEAMSHGFSHITHLYSCMSTVHRIQAYRHAGVVESAYLCDDLTVEIIADGVHLPKPLLQMVYRFIGPNRTALVTDSMRGAGLADGQESILGSLTNGQRVIIEDGVAKMPDRKAFAGSVATTDRLLRTMVEIAEVPLCDAIKMLTETPARIQKLYDRGTLETGKRADLVFLDDTLHVTRTIVGGSTVFSSEEKISGMERKIF
ncbi:MAG: N-acetylglucosamine-6-phosphate deacetylase [Clostridia bacterium]|nr:N-acetylglucosamine-6-phosphate deacetylase [Clostridia bacterium]